jgi:hypothetical protein
MTNIPDAVKKQFAPCLTKAKEQNLSTDDVGGCCMTDIDYSHKCPTECMADDYLTLCDIDDDVKMLCNDPDSYLAVNTKYNASCQFLCDKRQANGVQRKKDQSHWCYNALKGHCVKYPESHACIGENDAYACEDGKCVQRDGGFFSDIERCKRECKNSGVQEPNTKPDTKPDTKTDSKLSRETVFQSLMKHKAAIGSGIIVSVLVIIFIIFMVKSKKRHY